MSWHVCVCIIHFVTADKLRSGENWIYGGGECESGFMAA